MAELKDILTGDRVESYEIKALPMRVIPEAEARTGRPGSIMRVLLGTEVKLCYLDGNGDLFRFRMQAV